MLRAGRRRRRRVSQSAEKKPRARRLKTIAKYINESLKWAEYEAKVIEGYCNTDRKLGGGSRLIQPGKGRTGNRLVVRRKANKECVLDHNAAETYRTNDEVEQFVKRVEDGWVPDGLNSKAWWY